MPLLKVAAVPNSSAQFSPTVILLLYLQQLPAVQRCADINDLLSSHEYSQGTAGAALAECTMDLHWAKAPLYDLPTALQMLSTGTYSHLPDLIQESKGQEDHSPLDIGNIDTLLRSRFLDLPLPCRDARISVTRGRACVQVDGEYCVELSVGYGGYLSNLQVHKVKLLVGEGAGGATFSAAQHTWLMEDLNRRMAGQADPLAALHSTLHHLCSAFVMEIALKQIQGLAQDRWRNVISWEMVNGGEGEGPLGVLLSYWVQSKKQRRGEASPVLSLELRLDRQLASSHSPDVIDPDTGASADLSLNPGAIDVEQLLTRAIRCNVHSQLAELEGCLRGEGMEAWVGREESEEVLWVRLYGSSHAIIRVDLR